MPAGAAGSCQPRGSEARPENTPTRPEECKPCSLSPPRKEGDPLQLCWEGRSGCGLRAAVRTALRASAPPAGPRSSSRTRSPPSQSRVRLAPAGPPGGVDEACPLGTRRHEEPRGGLSAERRGQGPCAGARAPSPRGGAGRGWAEACTRGSLWATRIKERRLAAPRWEAAPPRPRPREGHGPGGPPAVTRARRPRRCSGRSAPVCRGFRRTGEDRGRPGRAAGSRLCLPGAGDESAGRTCAAGGEGKQTC